MFGIIFGTLCLIALIATIQRERYYRRHGYPQHPHGYYGCPRRCGYRHPCYGQPDAPASQTPSPDANAQGPDSERRSS